MIIKAIQATAPEWPQVIDYAAGCSWRAGAFLAQAMQNDAFQDWERVIVAMLGDAIIGYCTVSKTDCLPDVPYSPYIGYVFVDEKHRGQRISQQLIAYAMTYLKELGFRAVYLVSDHVDLYEKYGFRVIDRQIAPWGAEEKVYMQEW